MLLEPSIATAAADGGSDDEKVAGMKVAEATIPPVLRGRGGERVVAARCHGWLYCNWRWHKERKGVRYVIDST